MSIVFYSAPMSSASPVKVALLELDVPHETVTFNLASGDQKKPEFLKLNPNGRVPTLVIDGAPMFEALAIMQWLGDRYGVARGVWPAANTPARLRALSFSTWAYVHYGGELKCFNYSASERSPAELRNPALAKRCQNEAQSLLAVLDRELTGAPYLLGEEFGLVDLIVACVVQWGTYCGIKTDAHAHVTSWLARCVERPSMKAGWA